MREERKRGEEEMGTAREERKRRFVTETRGREG